MLPVSINKKITPNINFSEHTFKQRTPYTSLNVKDEFLRMKRTIIPNQLTIRYEDRMSLSQSWTDLPRESRRKFWKKHIDCDSIWRNTTITEESFRFTITTTDGSFNDEGTAHVDLTFNTPYDYKNIGLEVTLHFSLSIIS